MCPARPSFSASPPLPARWHDCPKRRADGAQRNPPRSEQMPSEQIRRVALRFTRPTSSRPYSFQPIQSHTARPITSSRSRPLSHGISSVNIVTHCFHGHGMRVMSVPQKHALAARRRRRSAACICGCCDRGRAGSNCPARRCLDRHIGCLASASNCRLVGVCRIVLAAAHPGVMVDDQFQAGMALGDLRRPAADSWTPSARSGCPAFSAAGHSQSIVPSVIQLGWCGWVKAIAQPEHARAGFSRCRSAPGSPACRAGSCRGCANRFGYLAAASSDILPEFGSQPGGCRRQASTPAASIRGCTPRPYRRLTWRCAALVGGPADQMWTCASTISMAASYPETLQGRWSAASSA